MSTETNNVNHKIDSLPYQTAAAIIANAIQDPSGVREVSHNIDLQHAIGKISVSVNEILPPIPEPEPVTFDSTHGIETAHEKKVRVATEAKRNGQIIGGLSGLLPEATYALNSRGFHRSKVVIKSPSTESLSVQAGARESLIWINDTDGAIPTVCIGAQSRGDKTNLLLLDLKGTPDSYIKWAQWSMLKTDLSGGPSIPLRNAKESRYYGGKIMSVNVRTDRWNQFVDTLPARMQKQSRKLEGKPIPDTFSKKDVLSEYTLLVPWSDIENYWVKPEQIDDEFADKYNMAAHLANVASTFQVSEDFSKICDQVLESNR